MGMDDGVERSRRVSFGGVVTQIMQGFPLNVCWRASHAALVYTTLTMCLRAESSLAMTDSDAADFLPDCGESPGQFTERNEPRISPLPYAHFRPDSAF